MAVKPHQIAWNCELTAPKQNRAAFVLPCPEPTIPDSCGVLMQGWVFTNNRECKYIH
jgi:hypothetical protein